MWDWQLESPNEFHTFAAVVYVAKIQIEHGIFEAERLAAESITALKGGDWYKGAYPDHEYSLDPKTLKRYKIGERPLY
jgi:hypothetical protein